MTARAAFAAAVGTLLLAVGIIGSLRQPSRGAATSGSTSMVATSDGSLLFQAKGCSSCHDGPDSTARISGSFPSLADAPSWAGSRRTGVSAQDYLAESMLNPSAFISPAFEPSGGPTRAMPDLGLSVAEVDALVAYLMAQ